MSIQPPDATSYLKATPEGVQFAQRVSHFPPCLLNFVEILIITFRIFRDIPPQSLLRRKGYHSLPKPF